MRLLAFGDSLVAGVGDPDHLGWIGRALSGRRSVTLYNLGVRRETSADVAARWRAEATPRWRPDEPMRLVFSFGTNDLHVAPGALASRLSLAETLQAAQAMLSQAQALAPTLLVGQPPPSDPAVAPRAAAMNAALQTLATRLKIPFVDVLDRLQADAVWRAEVEAYDGAHPGAAGYQALADLVVAHPAWRPFLRSDG